MAQLRATLEVAGEVDANRRLHVSLPSDFPVGRTKLNLVLPEEDEAGRHWADGIAAEWASELADPKEDIYTLEDGLPIDAPR